MEQIVQMRIPVCFTLGMLLVMGSCDSKSGGAGSNGPATPQKPEVWVNETSDHVQLFEFKKGKNGERINHGRCIFKTKENVVILDGRFVEGKENGLWRAFYRNGKPLFEGDYVLGDRVGEWIYWDEQGHVKKRENWVNGKMSIPIDEAVPASSQPAATSMPTSLPAEELPTFGR